VRYKAFRIINYKGIKDLRLVLDATDTPRVYTLVGLNETGKTTILEALHSFNPSTEPLSVPAQRGTSQPDGHACPSANAGSRHLNPWRRLGSELRWRGRVAGVGSACARPG